MTSLPPPELPILEAAFADDPYPYYAALRARSRGTGLLRDAASGAWMACSAAQVDAALAEPMLRVRPPGEAILPGISDGPAGKLFGALARHNDGAAHAGARDRVELMLAALPSWSPALPALRAMGLSPSRCEMDSLLLRAPVALLAHAMGAPPAALGAVASDLSDLVRGHLPASGRDEQSRAHSAAERLLARWSEPNRVGLLVQAFESTATLLGNALVALRREPDWCSRWQADPALDEPLLAEVARHDPPVQNTRRFAATDLSLCGQVLSRGDTVIVLLASASRDEAAGIDAPDRFDPLRAAGSPWTYGRGVHACPGAALSRRIAGALLRDWFDDPADAEVLRRCCSRWTYRRIANLRMPLFSVDLA